MLRRKWLEVVLGIGSAAIVMRDKLFSLAEAKDFVTPQEIVPTTTAAAIQTRKASSVASFILTNPTVATAATVTEKGTMVSLLGINPIGDVWTGVVVGSTEHQRYERAALTIVRGLERNPTDVATVLKSIGGRAVLEKRMSLITLPELRTIAQAFLRS